MKTPSSLVIDTRKCSGCLRCALACSEIFTKTFNPALSRIIVKVSGVECKIEFTDACNDCGICIDHCFYGALIKADKEQRV